MTKENYWGARPEDWQTFTNLGFTEDLLPVVSNPGAPVSVDSTIKFLGKTPSEYNYSGEVRGISKWTAKRTTDTQLAKWRAQPDYGICIQTRYVRAFDIDVEDRELSDEICKAIVDVLGFRLPMRYRDSSSKCLLAFRMKGEHGKRTIKVKDDQMIEMLMNGQQFIAAGTHPSGDRYKWVWPDDSESILELTEKQFEAVCFILQEEFAIADTTQKGLRKKASKDAAIVPDDIYDYLEENSHVLEYGAEGQLHIECPFADEHTTISAVSATSYFPKGSRGYERGHFVCLHAHCDHREDVDFEEALGIRAAEMQDLTNLEDFEEEQSRFQIFSFDEFISKPAPSWRIKGILPENGLAMLYGASGTGKSFLAIDIAAHIAFGNNWCGYKTNKGSVLYIAAEGAAGIRNRFKAIQKHNDLNTENIPISVIEEAPNLHQNDYGPLLKSIQKHDNVQVIIVDTLAQVTAGADENSGKDMSDVLNKCKKLQEVTGALVLLIHHTGKEEHKGPRGWSGVFAAMDTIIKVSGKKDTRIASVEKQKDGEASLKFSFKLHPVSVGFDEDGDLINSCIVQYTEHAKQEVELRGPWQVAVFDAAQSFEDIGAMPTPPADLINMAVSIYKDQHEVKDFAKRDRSSESAKRALENITEKGLLVFDNDFVAFPQGHTRPQIG